MAMETRLPKYDVFVNHWGPDLEKSSVALHLDAALRRNGLNPLLDGKSVGKGQRACDLSIDEVLAGVLVHVAIFSRSYAESEYCLEELCDMLESRKPVIPVFYGVEPKDLRCTEEVGPFAEALSRHRHKGRQKYVARWREALLEASYLPGCPVEENR